MTFDELVPEPHNWEVFQLNINENWVTSDPSLENLTSQNGWTYVYVVAGSVMYIGNTGSKKLSKRIRPELNQNVDNILNVNLGRKLAYTNIRISRQLKRSFDFEHDVVLRVYREIDCDSYYDYDNGVLQVNNFGVNLNKDFLLRWSPRSVQGRGLPDNAHMQFPLERALILKHVDFAEQMNLISFLPPWNLGLG